MYKYAFFFQSPVSLNRTFLDASLRKYTWLNNLYSESIYIASDDQIEKAFKKLIHRRNVFVS